ncbi:MAG: site-specific integrase [Alistipes sp.]|nr:site-specific integrase [Alistipes sp.]
MRTEMLKIKMVIQRGKPNKYGRVPILMQLTIGRTLCTISTKQTILPERWGDGKPIGHTREDQAIMAVLDELRTKAYNKFLLMQVQDINVTPEILKEALLGKDQVKPKGYVEIFDLWLDDYSKMVGITTTKRTFDKYILVRNRLQEFIVSQYSKKDIALEDVTPKFLGNFDSYLRIKYEMANNHAMKMRQKLRTIYKMAIDNGWVNKNPFSTVKIHFEPVEREVLTKTELATLMQTDMEIERLDRMRDIFVFACFTGLAHCDVANLTAENIVTDDNGQVWIKTHRQKTAEPVDIPLLEIPQLILNKYKDTKGMRGKLLPILTNSCCNIYLKEVATKCGINKTLTFHMARHTFATTVTLSNGVPIESVSKMLGHRNIRTTQIYAKVIKDKVAEDMNRLATRICGDYSFQASSTIHTPQSQYSA